MVYLIKLVRRDHQGCQKYLRCPNLSLLYSLGDRILNNLEESEFPLRGELLLSWHINSQLFVEPVASLLSSVRNV
jgi:hypothetical protein